MKLEDQVCSLELSKRLKDLGVKQESLFCWQKPWSDPIDVDPAKFRLTDNPHKIFNKEDEEGTCSAFTVAELFDTVIKDSNIEWKIFHSKNGWMIYPAGTPGYTMELPTFTSLKLADMLAELKVHLIEKGIVKP